MTEAFQAAKEPLTQAAMLSHPHMEAPTSLTVDTSLAVGGVLQQWVNNKWEPLAFFSKKLKPAETKYSTFARELLGMYLGIKHFRSLIGNSWGCI